MADDATSPRAEADGVPAEESRRSRVGRYARRTYLYSRAAAMLGLLVVLVILIAENTRSVKVGWVFGYSHISLVYLVLIATLLGWLLGIMTSSLFRRRTRRQAR